MANALLTGPTPADSVVERIEQIRRSGGPVSAMFLGPPLAQLGRMEQARREVAAGRAAAEELGLTAAIYGSYIFERHGRANGWQPR